MINISNEAIEPHGRGILEDIQTKMCQQLLDRVWDEIEVFVTPEAVQRYPRPGN